MDILNKNVLLKILLESRLKPDLNKFSYEELYQMCIDFNNDNEYYLSQSKYTSNTINLINSICQKMDIIENNNENNEKNLKKIIDWICDLWKKLPLLNNNFEVIDCGICLGFITNCDYICFQCEHLTHSSCFLNYLFSNIKNDTNKLLNLFRCPNCRNYLTSNIQTCAHEFNNGENENDIDNYDYNNSNNNENYNIITQQYDLTENSIDNYLNNNLNILFQNNRYNLNLNNNYIDYLTLNNSNIYISDTNSDCDSNSNNSFDADTDFSDT
jgi:hypothetical protein